MEDAEKRKELLKRDAKNNRAYALTRESLWLGSSTSSTLTELPLIATPVFSRFGGRWEST